jgi:hypothetical protein
MRIEIVCQGDVVQKVWGRKPGELTHRIDFQSSFELLQLIFRNVSENCSI